MPLLLIIFLLVPAFAADLYVKSLKAPLIAEPRNGSAQVLGLDRGTKVDSLSTEGNFNKVKVSGKEGYINKLFLSDKPDSKNSLLNQDIDISSKARKRASGFTSAAAARGLKEDSDDIFATLDDTDPVAIKDMESLKVKDDIGLQFLLDKSKKLESKKEESI